jgi:16S rRNA (cytosine967-C5)-methyltransferase
MDISAGPLAQNPGLWARQMPPIKSKLFQAGHFQPQGPTAMQAGLFSQVQPGQKVLDFCAGLGTKATHLAELMDNKGFVVASDISAEKLRSAEENASRLGISCIEFLPQNEFLKRFEPGTFDVVLVDVPCSNTGVLASRVDAKWRIQPQYLKDLARTQLAILRQASGFVAPHGHLLYSTCSTEPIENDELVTEFIHSDPTWLLEADKNYIPTISFDLTGWHDGGYMARWRRK